jgi:hypothetical protein
MDRLMEHLSYAQLLDVAQTSIDDIDIALAIDGDRLSVAEWMAFGQVKALKAIAVLMLAEKRRQQELDDHLR